MLLKQFLILLFLSLVFSCLGDLSAQVLATFEVPDTVCVGEEVSIMNTSTGGETFRWNFCGVNLDVMPQPESLGNMSQLNLPTYMTIVEDDGEYFGFVTNYTNHNLIRLDFGSSLSNTPEAANLGAFPGIVPESLEGISVHKDDGQWWGYAVAGYSINPSLIRYSFGPSIKNVPEAENLGNVGGMNFPHKLMIFEENGEWFGWVTNLFGFLVRLSFGDHLGDTPTGLNIGNVGELYQPSGFTTIQHNGQWHMFVANKQHLTRLDFGALLSNIPTGLNMGEDPNFNKIRDIIITKKCGKILGLVLNGESNDMVILDFHEGITNNPISILLPEVAGFDLPHSFSNLLEENSEVVFFVLNVNNGNLSRFRIGSCSNVHPPNASGSLPPAVSYATTGEYVIELIVDEGLVTESRFCKSILIIGAEWTLGVDTVICQGQPVELNSNIKNTTWPDGSVGHAYTPGGEGLYIAYADTLDCLLTDSILISERNCQHCLIFPNAFTPDGDGQNDTFSALNACPIEVTDFELKIFNRWGELVFLTIDIHQGWNGMYKTKPASMERYIWQANFSYPDAITGQRIFFSQAGELTLIR